MYTPVESSSVSGYRYDKSIAISCGGSAGGNWQGMQHSLCKCSGQAAADFLSHIPILRVRNCGDKLMNVSVTQRWVVCV